MRWSHYFLPTLREDPKDSDSISYKLMIRAGLIRRLGSGAYSYLPLGFRVLQKAIAIIREEMNRAGAQELLMPSLQPAELWKKTGRYDAMGEVLIRFKDRTDKEMTLGPTHEEVVTDLLKEVQSYKQLPMTVYQVQTKFRDEPRPRFGVIRSKEFLMKDAYSFDVNFEGLDKSYQLMYDAYNRIFKRCGLNVLACEADSGVMGGDASHEFMAPSPSGENRVVRCKHCEYAANVEAAKCVKTANSTQHTDEKPKPIESVKTPGKHTVEEVSAFLKVSPAKLIKTLIYQVQDESIAVIIRGDHDLNEAKLARLVKSADLKLADAKTVERISKAPVGFAGPVKLDGVRLLVDYAVMQIVNAVVGANIDETHLINVNPNRDFKPNTVADLRVVTDEDVCPKCGKETEFVQTIEIGHVFKLGTKYSEVLGAQVQDSSGVKSPMIMGCYGIGVNRIVASVLEQSYDKNGIIWPVSLAPFQVVISVLDADNPDQLKVGDEIYTKLLQAGFEVLIDDRVQSPGSKFKDADLIGIPVQVVLGKAWKSDKKIELCLRKSKEKTLVSLENLEEQIHKQLDKAMAL